MRNYLKNLDIWLYVVPIILTLTGIAVIYSLVYSQDASGLIVTQSAGLVIGVGVMIFLSIYDYRQLKNIVWPLYIASVILLLIVDVWGKSSGGATRWLQLSFVQIQPSEIFKLVAIIFWASYFSEKIGEIKWQDLGFLIVGLGIPMALILKQPDLGTALVIGFVILLILFWLKLDKKKNLLLWLLVLLFPLVSYLAVSNISYFGRLLKDYQRARIEVFLDPSKDVLGRGYNVKQAIIAVGSGGLTGKGLGQGTQSQLQFLPKAHTDFIFSGFAEAFGFLGSLVLISCFFAILTRIIRAGNIAKDSFGLLLAVGVAGMIFFQVVENIGMNIGLLPVTGIPLPFLSYGGSSLVICFMSLGIIQSVVVRHKKIIF
jgi:rod shape determining protein RodA